MAYTSALHNVSLAGPTLFGPVINNAALIASQSLADGGRKYFVLLIITVRANNQLHVVILDDNFVVTANSPFSARFLHYE